MLLVTEIELATVPTLALLNWQVSPDRSLNELSIHEPTLMIQMEV